MCLTPSRTIIYKHRILGLKEQPNVPEGDSMRDWQNYRHVLLEATARGYINIIEIVSSKASLGNHN